MTEKIEVTETGFVEADNAVQEAYENRYGEDNYVRHKVRGSIVYRAKIASDETKVSSSPDGAEIITSNTDPGTESTIKQNIGMASGQASQETKTSESHISEFAETHQEETHPKPSEPPVPSQSGGNSIREVYEDGYIEFLPQYTKEEAEYEVSMGRSEMNCEDCAHYIDGGGCHVVRGAIEPDAHCENYYADAGFFVRGSGVGTEVKANLVMWGERAKKRFEMGAAAATIQEIRERLEDYVGNVQFARD